MKKYLILALISFILFPAAAQAQTAGGLGQSFLDLISGGDGVITQIENFNTAMVGIVSSLTTVAIFPAGISASIRAFRHIVLSNV